MKWFDVVEVRWIDLLHLLGRKMGISRCAPYVPPIICHLLTPDSIDEQKLHLGKMFSYVSLFLALGFPAGVPDSLRASWFPPAKYTSRFRI